MSPSTLSSSALPSSPAIQSPRTLLEALIDSSDDAILTKDLNGIITSWNAGAMRIFGYTASEVLGKSILLLVPPDLHPEEASILARIRNGEQIAHYETRRITRSGVEKCISLTISPLRNDAGIVIGASKIARDISDRKEHDSIQRRLAAIVESSDDAIISKDLTGIVTTWNQAATRLFGYEVSEMVGHSILKLIPKDLYSEEAEIIARLRKGERIEHFETIRMKKSGERFAVSLTISPMRDSTGQIVGASKILRDISQRKALEASLLQAEKFAATGRMAATIAHEINNPLEGLLNLIYLARISADDPIQVVEYLSAAEGELDRISHIAKQTLGYYREHASAVPVPLAALVRDALAIYQPRLVQNGIHTVVDLPIDPEVVIKRGEIVQVLSNLIANSILAMQTPGKLHLTLEAVTTPHTGYVIQIRDNGSGISEEHLEKIFDPFFTTRGTIGTGIGLWVARKLVEGHGGSISVKSTTHPEDHGTTMSIFLPHQTLYDALPKVA